MKLHLFFNCTIATSRLCSRLHFKPVEFVCANLFKSPETTALHSACEQADALRLAVKCRFINLEITITYYCTSETNKLTYKRRMLSDQPIPIRISIRLLEIQLRIRFKAGSPKCATPTQ